MPTIIEGTECTDPSTYLTKGRRIRARWFGDAKLVALAGVQMKAQVTEFVVTGAIKHLRGNHPTNPTEYRVYVDPEGTFNGPKTRPYGCTCDHEHVEIDPKNITEVL